MQLRNATLALLFAAGCSAAPPVSSGNAALGITEFETNETSTNLSIVGYNAEHVVIAEVNLRRGYVQISAEEADGVAQAGDGQELNVNLKGEIIGHKHVGTMPVTLPLAPSIKTFGELFADPYVSAELARWDMHFEAQHASAEQQLDDPGCHTANGACGSTGCIHNADDSYEELCCSSISAFVVRSCSSGSTSNCGTNGPNGCVGCWNIPYNFICEVFNWPDCTIDYNGPSCDSDYMCQGVYGCSTCEWPYDANGYGSCNAQWC